MSNKLTLTAAYLRFSDAPMYSEAEDVNRPGNWL